MTQMVQEHKSLWRIEHNYKKEAMTDMEKEFWERLHNEKKVHIEELRKLIKESI